MGSSLPDSLLLMRCMATANSLRSSLPSWRMSARSLAQLALHTSSAYSPDARQRALIQLTLEHEWHCDVTLDNTLVLSVKLSEEAIGGCLGLGGDIPRNTSRVLSGQGKRHSAR